MAFTVSDTGGGDFKPAPAGTHFGVCDMIVDLGHQKTTYMGAETVKKQAYLRWQVPGQRIEWADADGNKREGPMIIGKTYTASLAEKANLRKDLQSWRGRVFTDEELKGFQMVKVLGIGATITVTHAEKNGRTFANIASVGGIPHGIDMPRPEGDTIIYDDDHPDNLSKLPKWLQDKIAARVEPPSSTDLPEQRSPAFDSDLDDDVPF